MSRLGARAGDAYPGRMNQQQGGRSVLENVTRSSALVLASTLLLAGLPKLA